MRQGLAGTAAQLYEVDVWMKCKKKNNGTKESAVGSAYHGPAPVEQGGKKDTLKPVSGNEWLERLYRWYPHTLKLCPFYISLEHFCVLIKFGKYAELPFLLPSGSIIWNILRLFNFFLKSVSFNAVSFSKRFARILSNCLTPFTSTFLFAFCCSMILNKVSM